MSNHSTSEAGSIASATQHYRQRDLATRWGLSIRSLERWRSLGQGPSFLKLGGRVCYTIEDILAFEKAQRRVGAQIPDAQEPS